MQLIWLVTVRTSNVVEGLAARRLWVRIPLVFGLALCHLERHLLHFSQVPYGYLQYSKIAGESKLRHAMHLVQGLPNSKLKALLRVSHLTCIDGVTMEMSGQHQIGARVFPPATHWWVWLFAFLAFLFCLISFETFRIPYYTISFISVNWYIMILIIFFQFHSTVLRENIYYTPFYMIKVIRIKFVIMPDSYKWS